MKKLISILLMLSLLFTTFISTQSVYASDSQPSTWAQGAINALKETGLFEAYLFSGYKEDMTRLGFTRLLVRNYEIMSGKEILVNPELSFSDTDDIDALKAYTVNLTSGLGDGRFGPDLPIDRKTMVTFIINFMKAGNMNLKPASAVKFSDDGQIPSWAKESIYISKSNNIVAGYTDNTFKPNVNASGEVGMVLIKQVLFESIGKTFTVNGMEKKIALEKPVTVSNEMPVNANGYIELKTSANLSSASKFNTVNLSIGGDSDIESVGLYQGTTPIIADIEIIGATVKITTDYLLPLDTAFNIKAFTTNGKRYSMTIRTPKYQKFVLDANKRMNIVEIPANPAKGFHYPYFITVPMNVLQNGKAPYEMLVDTNNTGRVNASSIYFYEDAKYWMSTNADVSNIASQINGLAVMTTFPRPEKAWEVYTHSLDRDSMLVTDKIIEETDMGNFKRLDLQLKAILADAKFQMESNGFPLNKKPMLLGFSASSDFANRYSIMYPETIKAVAIGHGTTMPFTTHNNITLNYPMGVADLKTISGVTFNDKAYKALPQFWFRGSDDTNDGTFFYDGWDTMGETYRKAFGEEIRARKTTQAKLLTQKGYTNITFKEYQGVSHGYSDKIYEDLIKFYNSVK